MSLLICNLVVGNIVQVCIILEQVFLCYPDQCKCADFDIQQIDMEHVMFPSRFSVCIGVIKERPDCVFRGLIRQKSGLLSSILRVILAQGPC